MYRHAFSARRTSNLQRSLCGTTVWLMHQLYLLGDFAIFASVRLVALAPRVFSRAYQISRALKNLGSHIDCRGLTGVEFTQPIEIEIGLGALG